MADPAVGRTLVLIAMVQTGTGAVPGPQPLGALLDAGAATWPSSRPGTCGSCRCGSALEAELALTLKVLGTVADGSQGDILDQPLHTLRHMHSELQVSAQSEAGPWPQGRLYHRVQCLHEAPKKKESLAPQAWTCRPCLFPRPRELRQLQVWERPVALEAELALTLKVLGTVADASQGDILDQPLHMLRHIHSELRACVSTGGPQTQGRLHHWLSQLHKAPKKSLSCLEASVMFNLFYLLIRDLKGVTSEDPCV
ncbi:interferon lambda-3-like [Panthera leo]|uniref:interferon lambda-3-like n=1 Tax=Panthera leo TaxID=9689 RepID=UPI001C69BC7E|nr:interferon lambda-3-like [Panthera leo]